MPAEAVVPFHRLNFLTGRFEWSQRDELFANDPRLMEEATRAAGRRAFPVSAYTAGYTRDIPLFRGAQTGLGINATAYGIGDELKLFYGDRPWGVNVFLRVRPR